jgi:hypothetical protein
MTIPASSPTAIMMSSALMVSAENKTTLVDIQTMSQPCIKLLNIHLYKSCSRLRAWCHVSSHISLDPQLVKVGAKLGKVDNKFDGYFFLFALKYNSNSQKPKFW